MDEDADNVSEDGEVIDDECVGYTPLERPANYSALLPNNRFPVQNNSESESEIQTTSDTDSDSDVTANYQKRRKLKPKLQKPLKPIRKQSKYNIWNTRIQEDILSDTLTTCDVTLKDRSRTVETYDYTLSANVRTNNKRTMSDRKNGELRLVKQSSDKNDEMKGSSRNIPNLKVTLEDTEEEIARDIANKLNEENEELLYNVVMVAGKEKAIRIYKQVKKIEQDGGMLVMNQSRRRTPGGVYFFLIKHDTELTQEQQIKIFEEEKQKYKEKVKIKRKNKVLKMKEQIAASKKNLPELLTRAELCVQKLVDDKDRSRKKANVGDVTNPPPTPETDCHECSGDGIDQPNNEADALPAARLVQEYGDDFLDLSTTDNMDLF